MSGNTIEIKQVERWFKEDVDANVSTMRNFEHIRS